MIHRLPDWEQRFLAAIERRREMPFIWGQNDCALFATSILRAFSGFDLATPWRGRWHSALSAARLVLPFGGLLAVVRQETTKVGLEEIPPRRATRGDLMAIPGEVFDIALTICNGSTVLGPGEAGIQKLPRGSAVFAWRIPFMRF